MEWHRRAGHHALLLLHFQLSTYKFVSFFIILSSLWPGAPAASGCARDFRPFWFFGSVACRVLVRTAAATGSRVADRKGRALQHGQRSNVSLQRPVNNCTYTQLKKKN